MRKLAANELARTSIRSSRSDARLTSPERSRSTTTWAYSCANEKRRRRWWCARLATTKSPMLRSLSVRPETSSSNSTRPVRTPCVSSRSARSGSGALPSARRRRRVRRHRGQVAIDAHQALEVGELTPKRHALAQLLHHGGLFHHVGLSAKESGERVLCLEGLRDELADVSPKRVREPVELEARHRAVTGFDLHDGGTRDAEVLRDLVLRHAARLARGADPGAKFLLGDCHRCPHEIVIGRCRS